MEVFAEYLARIDNLQHRSRMEEILGWVIKEFLNLMPIIAWNQPMFTDHGTFIIGFSTARNQYVSGGIVPSIYHYLRKWSGSIFWIRRNVQLFGADRENKTPAVE